MLTELSELQLDILTLIRNEDGQWNWEIHQWFLAYLPRVLDIELFAMSEKGWLSRRCQGWHVWHKITPAGRAALEQVRAGGKGGDNAICES